MAVNKVVYGTTVLVDLTSDTVDADSMVLGAKAHDKTGTVIYGNIDMQAIEETVDEINLVIGI